MKKSIFIAMCILFMISGIIKAQTVINPSNAYNDSDVGKFAKSFGYKMMNKNPWIGNFQNYSLEISKWDVMEWPNGGEFYRIFIRLSWMEVDGFTRKKYSYAGTLLCDKYGCSPMFLVKEQEQPSMLGLGKRTIVLSELNNYQKIISSLEKICEGVQWSYMPEGCLENN